MRYADIKLTDIANGPGVRVSLYVQGCEFRCKGCFNPETWSFKGGKIFDNGAFEKLCQQLENDYVTGVSVLGGEPLHRWNVSTVLILCQQLRKLYPDKSIWIYTGYTYETLDSTQKLILPLIDVLVDGQFEEENKVIDLRFRGSTNQRIIDVRRTLETDEIVMWEDTDEYYRTDD